MKWVIIIGGVLIGVLFLVVIVGAALPRRHVATRYVVINQPAAVLFDVMRDVARAPTWRSDLRRVDLIGARDGHPAFRETSRNGVITYIVSEEKAAERFVVQIADHNLPFGGQWTFELSPSPEGGTRVRITEDGEVKNPVFRFVARFVLGYTATIETYLRDLGRKFGQEVVPAE